jgi:hypothetical protein
MSRPESGAIRFGDDWPGLFLRGDDAVGYGSTLSSALSAIRAGDDPGVIFLLELEELRDLLLSVDEREETEALQLRSIDDCTQ